MMSFSEPNSLLALFLPRSCNETLSATISSARLSRTPSSFNGLYNEPLSGADQELISEQRGRMEEEDRKTDSGDESQEEKDEGGK